MNRTQTAHTSHKLSDKLEPFELVRRRNKRYICLLAAICILIGGGASIWLTRTYAPGEVLRYVSKRLEGHPRVELFITPIIQRLRPLFEQPVLIVPTPKGQGQQPNSLVNQKYTGSGRPIPCCSVQFKDRPLPVRSTTIQIEPGQDINVRMQKASAGDTIEFLPGIHVLSGNLRLHQAGTANYPIIVRAAIPGTVTINSSAIEGFVIEAPYWHFENLTIRGICSSHDYCEHAFHVVGKGLGTVIRNNRIEDFNAHIKVNGVNQQWPDNGLIQFNTLINHKPRETANPVTPIDLVGASGWQVLDNHIAHFVKQGGNMVSYGAFFKGGGENGIIARNLVVCTHHDISHPGSRVGISLGAGGTGKTYCRSPNCLTEHSHGAIIGNTIMHCNDFGIDINNANQSKIENNVLINTYGIDVRNATASVTLSGNVHDGLVRARAGGIINDHVND